MMNRNFAENTCKNSAKLVEVGDIRLASEDAFCCVARFSASLVNHSKVAGALEQFQSIFALSKVAIYRATDDDSPPRKIISVGDSSFTHEEADALNALVTQPDIKAGTVRKTIDTRSGKTLLLIVMRANRGEADVLQLTFPATADADSVLSLSTMAPALAVSWKMRQPGLASTLAYAQSRTRQSQLHETKEMPILSPENAYGLSRSEFRVCRLLVTGLKPKIIARELNLSIATIRTHLRNIYAKTEMAGQIEVVSHFGRSAQPMMQAA